QVEVAAVVLLLLDLRRRLAGEVDVRLGQFEGGRGRQLRADARLALDLGLPRLRRGLALGLFLLAQLLVEVDLLGGQAWVAGRWRLAAALHADVAVGGRPRRLLAERQFGLVGAGADDAHVAVAVHGHQADAAVHRRRPGRRGHAGPAGLGARRGRA